MPRAFVRLRGRPSAESGAAGFDFSGNHAILTPCYTHNIPFWPGKTPAKSLYVKEEMQYEGSQIPEKTAIYYYGMALLVVLLFNMVVSPLLMRSRVSEVDYGTFMKMIEEKNIGEVEVDDSQIVFTDKDGKNIYKTGAMNDPTLTERLYASGAKFAKDVEETMSPLLSFFLTFILPMLIFIGVGQYLSKKLMSQLGGPNAMAFGMGKSNAKVYVPSSEGIHFSDVAGEDEAKESLSEIVD